MKFIASCSFGKDSLAMVLLLLEKKQPLDEVIFYDTEMEFQAIYNNRDKLKLILEERGVKLTQIKPKNPFIFDMLYRPVNGPNGPHRGYGWCGGVCRWGTEEKIRSLDRAVIPPERHYVGIAADEPQRLARLVLPKVAPLADWGMTEQDALSYCRSNGWDWKEPSSVSETGYIDLYDILDRVSCWCCANKNRKELKNIWRYLPEYWQKLKYLQSNIERPMKKYCNKKYGSYGNLFDLEKVFIEEGIG